MRDCNNITIMNLEYFLTEKAVLEWFLAGVTGSPVSLAPDLKTALPWEDIISTPDIQATSQDGKAVYLIFIAHCWRGCDMANQVRQIAERESNKSQEVHILTFVEGGIHNIISRFPPYMFDCEDRLCYHFFNLAGTAAVIDPISPDVLKFLDFLAGRNEKLWEEEPFRSLFLQSNCSPCWADFLRWRRKKVFREGFRKAQRKGMDKLAAYREAEKTDKAFTAAFIQDFVEEVNNMAQEMKEYFPLETLEAILDISANRIAEIQAGIPYTEGDMKNFYLARYRKRD